MKVFTIVNHATMLAFPDQDTAIAAEQPDRGDELFWTLQGITNIANDLTGKELVTIYNSIAGVKQVTKFENRLIAAKRIWEAVQTMHCGTATTEVVAEAIEDSDLGTGPLPTPEQFDAAGLPGPKIEKTKRGFNITHTVDPLTGLPYTEEEKEYMKNAESLKKAARKGHSAAKARAKAAKPAKAKPETKTAAPKAESNGAPKAGTKTAEVVALLKRKNGVTITELMSKMDWQRHTVRGFMAGAMKKAGYNVESFKPEGGERTYRLPA
jgi:Protein of unknown function (DUF3489)